ncbi:signal transduction histidine kinase [Devosia sp. UYZn731]|uniref:histidine kinase dimerization/phospho-acceptor domain-containing protein n=1 Tax=Devosia sp. UYZn731 TaxID=3156345 RepID=UPI003397C099
MNADWTTSPSARRVLQHDADSRPAWLWSQDGQTLIWQNAAAELFLAKMKKHGLKLALPAIPIKGQIARNIRLGSNGRTSLARIQFLAGEKPTSSTCATTPLLWEDDQPVLLIVGVDPIDAEILAAAEVARDSGDGGAPSAAPVQAVADEPQAAATDPIATIIVSDDHAYERELESWRAVDQDRAYEPVVLEEQAAQEITAIEAVDATAAQDGGAADEWNDEEAQYEAPLAAQTAPELELPSETLDDEAEPPTARGPSRLSNLVDRLAVDEHLYTPLTDADDVMLANSEPEPDLVPDEAAPQLFTITGRGFTPLAPVEPQAEQTDADADLGDLERLDDAFTPEETVPEELKPSDGAPNAVELAAVQEALSALGPATAPDTETVERVSRYNFDELSRILNDRVGETAPQPSSLTPIEAPATTGALVNLGGETLVLNRLPLGILVFRDQQILFANRAITEMVGYGSVETLRNAGLASVFPAAGTEGQQAGPVNHLVQRDGTLVPVTARLQSISWQGRPALMLSASATEVRTGHEAAVRAFAESFADTRGDGFFETNRAGVIAAINGKAAMLLGQDAPTLMGKALSAVIAPQDLSMLQEFLERPARFAETARPCVSLRGASNGAEILVFAQGQAGTVTGYFGFVHPSERQAPVQISGPAEVDPALLARISRGVRRPLNTIIGFSDLIRSEAFGALANERYEGYADDIAKAGHEIAALVDELDDFTRLRDGRYLPQRASIDLTGLLESCVVRIRSQASNSRVIVRNAISETLPKVTADRASLAQAVLNLLASAIDQTPTGGAVVISAQHEDDGGISIHVRDSSTNAVDLAERFVVFRDGTGRDGQVLAPVRSSVGLALTRSLLAVNAFSLSVDPAGSQGLLFSLLIPADLVAQS